MQVAIASGPPRLHLPVAKAVKGPKFSALKTNDVEKGRADHAVSAGTQAVERLTLARTSSGNWLQLKDSSYASQYSPRVEPEVHVR
jgi:hypothetical protein